MRVLYAIQGTGNGHLSRARDVIPALQKRCEVDILVSGIQADVTIPYEIKYKLNGMSFIFGKKGGVDIWKTYQSVNVRKLLKEIRELPVEDYDIVINDFEPVSAWACRKKKKKCIALSHQSAVAHPKSPKPKSIDFIGKYILNHYAPTDKSFGFHFKPYAEDIFTPVIREEVRNQKTINGEHITVYLPSYDDEKLINELTQYPSAKWDVFSKHNKTEIKKENVTVRPINNEAFIKSMAESNGVLCGAGFETPAEAMHLGKKIMVIPMKTQYEQQCNAAALKDLGAPVISKLSGKYSDVISNWIHHGKPIDVDYQNITEKVIDKVFEYCCTEKVKEISSTEKYELKS